jgi:hypothetical protein
MSGWYDTDLADLIGGIGSGIHDVVDGVQDGIDAMVNTAAVGMLNSLLPPMVHTKNALIRSGSWVSVEAGTVEVASRVAGVAVGNAVLAGLVAKKVEEGVATITSDLDYMHGVNSIT